MFTTRLLRSAALLALICAGLCGAQLCDIGNNTVLNGGFEQFTGGLPMPQNLWFRYESNIHGWEGNQNTVRIRQGSLPWGGLHTHQVDNTGEDFYLGLQRTGAIISQTFTLTPGTRYTLKFSSAERPTHGNGELISVILNGVNVIANRNPPNQFEIVTYSFTANRATNTLNFTNTSPQTGDFTVFIDDVSICEDPLETTQQPTVTTTTTVTTHTFANAVNQTREDLMFLSDQTDDRFQNQAGLITALTTRVATLESQLVAATTSQQSLSDRLDNIQVTIAQAVSQLPVPSVSNSQSCAGSTCTPSVEAIGNNVKLNSRGGDVTIDSATCGEFSPCDLLLALNALRQLS